MRVCIYQADGTTCGVDRAERVLCMKQQCLAAAEARADLIVFPECYADGYPPDASAELVEKHLESAVSEAATTAAQVRSLAVDHGVAILYGHIERIPSQHTSPDAPYLNSVTLVEGSSGEALLKYSKLHTGTWHPEGRFARGPHLPPIIEFHGIRLAAIVCYDAYFPELWRALKRQGVQLVIVTWASTVPQCVQSLTHTRALENEIAVISVDWAAPYEGGSCYVEDTGNIHSVLQKKTVSLEVVQVDVHDMRGCGRTWDPVGDLAPQLKSMA